MQSALSNVPLDAVTACIQVRKISASGVKRLAQSIKEHGYNERYPIALVPINGTGEYKLLDGNHRLDAARLLALDCLPAQIFSDITPDDEYRIAYESNRSHDAMIPQDWTDDAEFIWSLVGQGKTQQQIADIMRWSRALVAQYVQLRNIVQEAWQVILVTTKQQSVTTDDGEAVTQNVTAVTRTFSERLLRDITSLTAKQQLDLVKDLAAGRINKERFKALAERYKVRNGLHTDAERRLSTLPAEYLERARVEIEKGIYDRAPAGDFDKLIQQLLDEYAKKQNYTLLCSDIRGLTDVEPTSIDAIITDPPYPREYLPLYENLAKLAAQVLKPGGSLLVMVGQSYLPEVLAMMVPHIAYHWTIAYLTPGGQAVQLWQRNVNTFWKPVLWFVNGDYAGKWAGDVARSATNDNDKRYHDWGQSESGMSDLIERFTTPGQTILDPFCGGGATGVAAIRNGRKFIGADVDAQSIETTRKRLQEIGNE